ncbi:DUF475 domain-containing protein [Massilia dura]|uniref:DUF475 domain-containing protein n=1 Tax=Pseudoduganella dura TaxID=321982 RepID=A0A6I3X3U6_9BURK|nr:DUF475 domain-containing protein [Pseudoduganella dura]GGX97265.1 hypothetical protein GCM10007386_30200 [Pseudoduganella dura]
MGAAESGGKMGDIFKRGCINDFMYLVVLGASFSFDGVIVAFAITKDVVIIMLGLAIDTMYIRSMPPTLLARTRLTGMSKRSGNRSNA